jgi:hypothetical protein
MSFADITVEYYGRRHRRQFRRLCRQNHSFL